MLEFWPGIPEPAWAHRFERAFISINRLNRRAGAFRANRVIVDSGAFSELERHGHYRHGVRSYYAALMRWSGVVHIEAAVSQDYMCEPFILAKTGLTVADHQRLTISRYDTLMGLRPPFYIMPVIQGFTPAEYIAHVRAYGRRLKHGAWVGVGSVCKRQGDPALILAVLEAIKAERPDLRLHGFGVKKTALANRRVRQLLATADSMAWSFNARMHGRDQNDWREAKKFQRHVEALTQ